MSNSIELTNKEKSFKETIIREERDALKNIIKADDKQMVAKIIRLYEEAKKNDNQ